MSAHRSICLILAVLSPCLVPAHAAPVSPSEQQQIDASFARRQRETKTYQAKVSQTVQLAGMTVPASHEADIYYVAPKQFLVRFTQPAGDWLLIRDETILLKTAGQPAKKIAPPEIGHYRGALMFMQVFENGGVAFKDRYRLRMERSGNEITVTLTRQGKGKEGDPNEIVCTLNNADLEMKKVIVSLGMATAITYEFSQIRRDQELDRSIFDRTTAVPPAR